MKFKLLFITCLTLVIAASQLIAAPNLYLGGMGGTLVDPAFGDYESYGLSVGGVSVTFSLLFEETPHAAKNTFFLHSDFNTRDIIHKIFDDDEGVGTMKSLYLDGFYGMSLLNDLNDNGTYDAGTNDVWLFSNTSLTLPTGRQEDDYQWIRPYFVGDVGVQDYYFEEGGLSFTGDYDAFLFIDDDHVTGPNKDHNDMVIGMNVSAVPEPGTLILLGLGLTGAGIIRRRKK